MPTLIEQPASGGKGAQPIQLQESSFPWRHETHDGAHTVAHVMFYTPRIDPADWGANMDNSPIAIDPRAKNDPEPFNIFVMFAGSWSDGSPAPLR